MGEEVVEQGWMDGWMEAERVGGWVGVWVSDWLAGCLVEVGVLSGRGWDGMGRDGVG